MRLDKYLFEKGHYSSREKASIAIKKGLIYVDGKLIIKPSFEIENGNIEIKGELLKYVSFGGNKLERAINYFNLDFSDTTILDIGASTGGFTDCALKHGAKIVYAVDVGSMQLDSNLKQDKRVLSFENTNILDFYVPVYFDYLVMDISFVSITKVIPSLKQYLGPKNKLVCLIKPQFEVGHVKLKNGVVTDKNMHIDVINKLIDFIQSEGLYINDLTYSAQKGKKGNIEYLALISQDDKIKDYSIKDIVNEAFSVL